MPQPSSKVKAEIERRKAEISELDQHYDACFRSIAGRRVLQDLIQCFDAVRDEPVVKLEATMYLEGQRRIMHYLREMTGDLYHEMAAKADAANRRIG